MSNWTSLKSDISSIIKANANQEITGTNNQWVLFEMVNALGGAYMYKGLATTSTNPSNPDGLFFYITTTGGTYTNFLDATATPIEVTDNVLTIIKGTGNVWSADEIDYTFGVENFTELDDTPTYYTGYGGYHVSVNSAEDGLEFTPALGEGATSADFQWSTDTTETDPTSGYVKGDNATYDNITEIYISGTTRQGNSAEFILDALEINDLLSIISNNGDKYIVCVVDGDVIDNTGWYTIPVTVVYSDGTFLNNQNVNAEFGLTPTRNFIDLRDTPTDYTGAAGKIVAVNSTEDGVEFVDASSGSYDKWVVGVNEEIDQTALLEEDGTSEIQEESGDALDEEGATQVLDYTYTDVIDDAIVRFIRGDGIELSSTVDGDDIDITISCTVSGITNGGNEGEILYWDDVTTSSWQPASISKIKWNESTGRLQFGPNAGSYVGYGASILYLSGYVQLNFARNGTNMAFMNVTGFYPNGTFSFGKDAGRWHTGFFGTGSTSYEALNVTGAVAIGAHSTTSPIAGTVEWSGTNFRGFDGSVWLNFDEGVSTFLELSDTPSSYSGSAQKFVKVNAAGDALEFVSGDYDLYDFWTVRGSSDVDIESGDIVEFVGGTDITVTQQSITGGQKFTFDYSGSGGGATTFLGLTDTPSSYSGSAEYRVMVNSAGNALEFLAPLSFDTYIVTTESELTAAITACNSNDGGHIIVTELIQLTQNHSYDLSGIVIEGVGGGIIHKPTGSSTAYVITVSAGNTYWRNMSIIYGTGATEASTYYNHYYLNGCSRMTFDNCIFSNCVPTSGTATTTGIIRLGSSSDYYFRLNFRNCSISTASGSSSNGYWGLSIDSEADGGQQQVSVKNQGFDAWGNSTSQLYRVLDSSSAGDLIFEHDTSTYSVTNTGWTIINDISIKTSETPDTADELMFYDVSEKTLKKTTVSNLTGGGGGTMSSFTYLEDAYTTDIEDGDTLEFNEGTGISMSSQSVLGGGARLTVSSSTYYGCSVYGSGTGNLGSSYTAIAFNNENYDDNGFHSNTTNNTRITIPSSQNGRYHIHFNATIQFSASGVTDYGFAIYKNGTIFRQYVHYAERNWSTAYASVDLNAFDTASVSDYYEVYAYASGGTAAFRGTTASDRPTFTVQKLT